MSKVERYYDQQAENEWNRLQRHRLEFAVSMRAFADYLPKPPARILDIGGGPGRYSIALAKLGYDVTLLDLSAGLLAFARQKAADEGVTLADVIHGNALDLSGLADESFDAVLLMGPLYHLLEAEQRRQALAEAVRVLKPGGILAGAFIGRYAVLFDWALYEPEKMLTERDRFAQLLIDGTLEVNEGFTDAYLAHPDEVKPFMEAAGLQTLALMASDSLLVWVEEKLKEMNDEVWAAWADTMYRLAQEPSLLGASGHYLYLGRKG